MGHWGVRSYENDEAGDALDAAFEQVHGNQYEELMDDRNPLSFDQVQKRLADERTLAGAVSALEQAVGGEFNDAGDAWDEEARLALAGIVVRHAEFGVAIPEVLRRRALACLMNEEIEWDQETKRRLRREKEIAMLQRARGAWSGTDERK
jgi:hypothetical protein